MDKAKAREEKKISNKFTVLFVGRLTKKKGVALLLNIARKLNHIQFVFIGVGPLESMLITASKDNNNIKFLGKKKNKELVDYYNTADIFCIPSLYEEGYGRVVVEAVACGVPVVGSNKGGIKEALNDSVSILVDPEEANIELAILELHNDKDKLKKLSNNCYAYSRIFFSKDNLKQITNNYK
jgi:glycosyltransferase involved in cell wall biosynthesis